MLLLLSVVRPSIEYSSEVWDKRQTNALESILLGGAKKFCVLEPVMRQLEWSRRHQSKLKWW